MAENSEPLSPKETLQSFLGEGKRPSQDELKQKNILKDSTVAPALQGQAAELERKKKEDELGGKLSRRPTVDEVVDKRILDETERPDRE